MVFTLEQDQFILEAYFRTGVKDPDGDWSYSVYECRDQCLQEFAEFEAINYDVFCCHIRRIVERFRKTGSVCKGKSTGRKSILTDDVLDDIQHILTTNPNTSVRSLAKITGMSFGTCHRAIKELQKKGKPKQKKTKPDTSSSSTEIPPISYALPSKIQGRRIVDLQYFFLKLQAIGSHKNLLGCSIMTIVILGEVADGFSSNLHMYCKSCKAKFTCPLLDPVSKIPDINKSAVLGSVEAGIPYGGLTKLFDNIGMPSMSEDRFKEILLEEKLKEDFPEGKSDDFPEEKSEEDEDEEDEKTDSDDCCIVEQMPVEVFVKEENDLDYCDIELKKELI